jgi:hypothetical protein
VHCDQGDRQAKEAYIVTVVPYADSNYACRPLVVLASCKSSTARQDSESGHHSTHDSSSSSS